MAHQPDKHAPAAAAHGHGVPDHASGEGDHQHDHDTTKYWMVFGALCVLTTISVGTMQIPGIKDTPTIGWTIMLAVSCAKAMLVITFFMHLLWEASWKYVLTIPAATMSLFLIFMLVPDIGLRTWWYTEERRLQAADPNAFVESTHHEEGTESGHPDPGHKHEHDPKGHEPAGHEPKGTEPKGPESKGAESKGPESKASGEPKPTPSEK